MSSNRVALEIEYDDESRENACVYVWASVNGVRTRFLLDTGCAQTTFAHNDPTAKNLNSLGTRSSSGVFGRSEYDLIELTNLELGPIATGKIQVARARAGATDRNLLGMDILKNSAIVFDFKNARLEFHAPGTTGAKHRLTVDRSSIPYVTLEYGETKSSLVWDTGAGITLVDQAWADSKNSGFTKESSSDGTDSTGTKQSVPSYRAPKFKIAGKEFPAHTVAAVDFSHVNTNLEIKMRGLVGYPLYKHATWIFDFAQLLWDFKT